MLSFAWLARPAELAELAWPAELAELDELAELAWLAGLDWLRGGQARRMKLQGSGGIGLGTSV